ncbi:MAG TPA: helix-turn-helix transcriptional regulator [Saprospiraceae bacterium]|nr:helix-turn-helix transcriptional regulator [Saprospiraceae bacterium]
MLICRQKTSQAELGKIIGTSGDVIGRYERGDITPSVDVVAKVADNLEVSVDYLIGKTKLVIDKNTLNRLEEISNLPEDKTSYVFNLIDMCHRDFKTKKAYPG